MSLLITAALLRVASVPARLFLSVSVTWWGVGLQLAFYVAGLVILGMDVRLRARGLSVAEGALVVISTLAFSVGETPTVAIVLMAVGAFLLLGGRRVALPSAFAGVSAVIGLGLGLALGGLGGSAPSGSSYASPTGTMVATVWYAEVGAMGSNHWQVYVVPRFLPLVRKQVYLGPDGAEPRVEWSGASVISVNGRQVGVFEPQLVVSGD